VVATRVGGTSTVVVDGQSGFLTAMGDVDGMAAHLEQLARDSDLRTRLGKAGAADVRERFATSRMADELDAIYRRVLAR
jgi:L-malate glycosyltransferase